MIPTASSTSSAMLRPPTGRCRPCREFDFEEFLDAVFEDLGDAPDAADVAAVEIGGAPSLPSPASGGAPGRPPARAGRSRWPS
jgi:hypothetical protein